MPCVGPTRGRAHCSGHCSRALQLGPTSPAGRARPPFRLLPFSPPLPHSLLNLPAHTFQTLFHLQILAPTTPAKTSIYWNNLKSLRKEWQGASGNPKYHCRPLNLISPTPSNIFSSHLIITYNFSQILDPFIFVVYESLKADKAKTKWKHL